MGISSLVEDTRSESGLCFLMVLIIFFELPGFTGSMSSGPNKASEGINLDKSDDILSFILIGGNPK